MLSDEDRLQPYPQELEEITSIYSEYWCLLVKAAICQYNRGVSLASVIPRNVLCRVPAICKEPRTFHRGSPPTKILYAEGSSTWKITGEPSCDISEREVTTEGSLWIGTQTPISCQFIGGCFRQWIGMEKEGHSQSYLGILALGWSYILSARLVETLENGAILTYTGSTAEGFQPGPETASACTVDIGCVDPNVARWWAAILAPNQGWKAVISQQEDGDYLSPWSTSLESSPSLCIKWDASHSTSEDVSDLPPTSEKAFEYLVQFSRGQNLGSQFLVALATAMMFPSHLYFDTTVQLPLPAEVIAKDKSDTVNPLIADWASINEELPYYISLSCNPHVVVSSLCGMFWEPNIPCNLVSSWLHPILVELPKANGIAYKPGFYYELLAIACCIRRPRISSLWLGAVISGLTPFILEEVQTGKPLLDSDAYPWTGCPQSFMDIAGSGPYIESFGVKRGDVAQLLHLTAEDNLQYSSRPTTPWKPFGSTSVGDCTFQVQSHLHCQRHHIEYQHWNWQLEDGSVVRDHGFTETATEQIPDDDDDMSELEINLQFPKKEVDEEASETASADIFQWMAMDRGGVRMERIYLSPWLQCLDSSEE